MIMNKLRSTVLLISVLLITGESVFSQAWIRINQLGYTPGSKKVAVMVSASPMNGFAGALKTTLGDAARRGFACAWLAFDKAKLTARIIKKDTLTAVFRVVVIVFLNPAVINKFIVPSGVYYLNTYKVIQEYLINYTNFRKIT